MNIEFIGMACALGLSAMGSAFGSGFAAQASVGAWKKCYANGKPAPFIMVAFSGAPLTQTIYGFLLMNFIRSAVEGGCDAALAMFTGHRPVRLLPGQGGRRLRRRAGRDRKGHGKLLHCHRYYRNGGTVHPGVQPAAAPVTPQKQGDPVPCQTTQKLPLPMAGEVFCLLKRSRRVCRPQVSRILDKY